QDRSPPRTPTAGAMGGPEVTTEEIRSTTPLMENWRFIQDDNLTDEEALASNAAHWEEISLPHTWNAEAATIGQSPPYKRGLGWYNREIATPTEGERHWL